MEIIQMSAKERKQIEPLKKLLFGKIDLEEAAAILNLSTRQTRRKLERYQKAGTGGLIHKSRGKPNKRGISPEIRAKAIDLIKTYYYDFGPTFASEKLAEEHQIDIHHETLRRLMIEAGIWHKKKKRSEHRKWREPRENRGAMAQFDGSDHDWFEGRGERCTLLKFVDDATKEFLWMGFAESESNMSVMTATKSYFKEHGKPLEIYVDRGKTFKVNVNNPDNERLTQYNRALHDLGVKLHYAYSPQAKGRIERSFQTDQDRLVKEMRLKGISNIDDANKFLKEYYMPKYSTKYAVKPAKSNDLHQSIVGYDLDHIFSIRSERQLHHDFTIRYKNRLFQLTKHQPTLLVPKKKIMVFEQLNGDITLQIRQCKLNHIEIHHKKELVKRKASEYITRPAKNHPWRRSNSYLYSR
jgi:transposase